MPAGSTTQEQPSDVATAHRRGAGRRLAGLLLGLLAAGAPGGCRTLTSEERLLEAQGRVALSLDGAWQVWLDPAGEGGEAWAAELSAGRAPPGAGGGSLVLAVPGPLEATAETRSFDGVAFYVRTFRAPARLADCRLRLRLEQVNYACRAWLDGVPVGEHEGSYDPVTFDVTGRLARGREHRLVVMVVDPGASPVHGLTLRTTPHGKESWYQNFGGLLGPVTLHCDRGFVLPSLAVQALAGQGDATPPALRLRGTLLAPPAPRGARATVPAAFSVFEDGSETPLARHELQLRVAADGRADIALELPFPGARLWSPRSPQLYRLVVEAEGRVLAERTTGFRSVALQDGDLLLNGERRVLKGVLWQPHFTGTGGVTPPAAELEAEAAAILATGFDFVRAHVRPAPPAFLDACDRLGLLVLQEPAIGWVEPDPGLLPRMRHELDWMVGRDGHHPSIILWGVLNELSGKAYRHAGELTRHLATLDPTRPVLEDSGGFIGGGRYVPPRGDPSREPIETRPMVDVHLYPPWPLPPEERDHMATLAAPDGQPVFVSEYGYGTLLDTVAAVTGFRQRGVIDEERVLFESYAATARRAAASGEDRTDVPEEDAADGAGPSAAGDAGGAAETTDGADAADLRPPGRWVEAAAQQQADAAEDMTEALRSNPALDLLCYTQWRAVSSECSAGLLDPWGTSRPARERMRRVLRPLLSVVLPDHAVVSTGEEVGAEVTLVNDTGRALRARGLLRWTATLMEDDRTGDVLLGDAPDGLLDVPPGVSRHRVTLLPEAGSASIALVAVLLGLDAAPGEERVIEQSTERKVDVRRPLPLPPSAIAFYAGIARGARIMPWPAVWSPPGDAEARAALERLGQPFTPDSPDGALVALISHPERLDAELSLDEQVRLWSLVRRGGMALVLLPDPADDGLAGQLGQRLAVRTLAALPVPVVVGTAAGNFMGRFHVVKSRHGDYLEGRGKEALSPRALVLDGLPEDSAGIITLGHLGNRVGVPQTKVSFGRGDIALSGLPLLQPLRGAPDLQHDVYLAGWLHGLIESARRNLASAPREPRPPRAEPLATDLNAELTLGMDIVSRLLALGDRASPLLGLSAQGHLPPRVAGLPAVRASALEALLEGRGPEARDILLAALAPLWTDETQRFLALEDDVLAQLGARVKAAGRDDWDVAYEAVAQWARGVTSWCGGDGALGLEWLGRARETLQTDSVDAEGGGAAGAAGA